MTRRTTPPLTLKTLKTKSGPGAPEWKNPADLDRVLGRLAADGPPIGILESRDGKRVAGRYFPSIVYPGGPDGQDYKGPAILIYRHEDDLVTLATAVHELCHHRSYCEECGAVPQNNRAASICRYKGEHDDEFYKRLEPMYIEAGVPTYAARAVEGSYSYPKHWHAGDWP